MTNSIRMTGTGPWNLDSYLKPDRVTPVAIEVRTKVGFDATYLRDFMVTEVYVGGVPTRCLIKTALDDDAFLDPASMSMYLHKMIPEAEAGAVRAFVTKITTVLPDHTHPPQPLEPKPTREPESLPSRIWSKLKDMMIAAPIAAVVILWATSLVWMVRL